MLPDDQLPALRDLADLLRAGPAVALTGAGCSTESGIPDYRGPLTRQKARDPVQYKAFLADEAARRRYWAGSFLGWPRFQAARPNAGHRALAALERAGFLAGVITQNVDGLHAAAGSRRIVELHGTLSQVGCLECGRREPREALQGRLAAANPGWDRGAALSSQLAPDGDVSLSAAQVADFRPVACAACGGALKPAVVFFGESVPPPVTAAAWSLYAEGRSLLVVGSSLAVFSGYRFVHRAAEEGRPVGLVNLGPTRGDAAAAVRVEAPAGAALPLLAEALGA